MKFPGIFENPKDSTQNRNPWEFYTEIFRNRFYPKPKFKRHLNVHLANAIQSYGNGHKNIEYNYVFETHYL
ncbi:hypothetical protein BLOT_014348 [Blomia tropicalis]|nr:hypothetical protein BLOT_014348 [Blomia tropicalis]